MLTLFRNATELRARLLQSAASADSFSLEWTLDADGRLMVVRSDGVRVVVAMGETSVRLPAGEVVISSEPVADGVLPVDAAAWVVPE